MSTVTLTTDSGRQIAFVDEVKASGAMKDIYFSPDRSYVVGFFRDPPTNALKDRLRDIVTRYRENLFEEDGGDFWRSHFCWPTDTVTHNGRIGVVVPFYEKSFFFEHGSKNNDMLKIRGKDKEGKWFASASNREKFLDPREKGNWLTHMRICLSIARAVRRLHMAGLAHSDLSYKNVLVDPTTGRACIIDIDGLVVPGKYPPDVVGTPDFIAPEVIATQGLSRDDPKRVLPSRTTDRYALAVLIYMYLLYRHPLRGRKVFDPDPTKDEELGMGRKALFVEHPTDASNRVNPDDLRPQALPWGDPAQRPYTMAGPLLVDLFNRAFIEGLHAPEKRPSPADWESALVRTLDMIQPCSAKCEMGWYVFDNSRAPVCPHCRTPYRGKLPVLNLYSSRTAGNYRPDNHRLMVWDGQSLFPWHANRTVYPNEHLEERHKRRVGYFQFHAGDWYLVNEALPGMRDVTGGRDVPLGGNVKLAEGAQILLSPEDGGRLVQVQMAGS
jgi:serine/threonine protein kinase